MQQATLDTPPADLAPPPSPALARIAQADHLMGQIARRVATCGALLMLGVALFTTFDVMVMRWLLSAPVAGSNEIFHTFFPAAIALVLASGLSERATLEIDLLGPLFGPRVLAWLRAFGAAIFVLTLVFLAWAVWKQALSSWNRGTQTTIMHIPLWPFYFLITASFVLCIPAQGMVALRAAAELCARWWHGVAIVFGLVVLAAVLVVPWMLTLQGWLMGNMLTAAGLLIGLLWVMILLYVPLAAALSVTACFGILAMFGANQTINVAGAETKGLLTSLDLAVVPFFLMMGGFAVQSGMSRDIYALAQALCSPFRGGLALATIGGSAGFGALTGSSVATVATIGSVSYPEMEKRGYAPSLAAGSIAAGGTLGQLLPPSTAAVVYALLVEQSIGALYMAMIVPAFLTIAMYMGAIMITVRVSKGAAPKGEPWNMAEILGCTWRALPAIVMFGLVFGGILFGFFTASEAAGVGAVVAFAVLIARGGLKGGGFWRVMAETTRSTSMIYFLIIGALITTFFFSATGLPEAMVGMVDSWKMQGWQVVAILCIGYILLGFVLDSMAIMMITASLSAGIVGAYGYDAVWWGVVMVVVVEIGVITPPFGLNLFMLKSVAPDLRLNTLYRGVMPFVLADFIKLALLIAFPAIIMWLPSLL